MSTCQSTEKAPVSDAVPVIASSPCALKSALKRPATGNARTRRRKNKNLRRHSVCFDRVQIREYDRLNNGSGGVPTTGTYALGLCWGYREDPSEQMSIAEYECERAFKRSYFPMALSESMRRSLLEKFDPEHAAEGANGTEETREMKKLIQSRKESSCCSCQFGACCAETCSCYQAQMPCDPLMCQCRLCANPYVACDVITDESAALSKGRIRSIRHLLRSLTPSSKKIKVTDVPTKH